MLLTKPAMLIPYSLYAPFIYKLLFKHPLILTPHKAETTSAHKLTYTSYSILHDGTGPYLSICPYGVGSKGWFLDQWSRIDPQSRSYKHGQLSLCKMWKQLDGKGCHTSRAAITCFNFSFSVGLQAAEEQEPFTSFAPDGVEYLLSH